METKNKSAFYYEPSLWNRIWMRLFPHKARPFKEGDPRTYLTTNVHVHVDWADRIRLLVTGHAVLQVVTYTDVEVREAESISVFHVEA